MLVEVDLEDYPTDELLDELRSRGQLEHDSKRTLTKIWELKKLGKDFDAELDKLIYFELGKVL